MTTTLSMIDVSDNNHDGGQPIDWSEVMRSGVRAVMIKATQGTDYTNEWLDRDAHGARAAGLHIGYYHFAEPSVDAANVAAESDRFTLAINGLPRDIGVALDLEVSNGLSWAELATYARAFLDPLAAKGIGTALYVNASWFGSLPGAPWNHRLWLASWGVRPRRSVWAWQSSGTGACPGVPGECDLDVLFE